MDTRIVAAYLKLQPPPERKTTKLWACRPPGRKTVDIAVFCSMLRMDAFWQKGMTIPSRKEELTNHPSYDTRKGDLFHLIFIIELCIDF